MRNIGKWQQRQDMIQKGLLKKGILWLAGILFVVLYLYADVLFDHYKISFTSHMYKVAPWKTESIDEKGPLFTDIEDSEYPALYSVYMDGDGFSLWNNQVALGAETSFSYLLYPLNYVYFLPIDIAIWLKTVLEFFIGFLGVFLLLKAYDSHNIAAAAAGICYAFSATIVMWLGWGHSDVAAWAPFAFFLVERLVTSSKLRYGIGLSVVLFLMLVAGMPTFAAYFMYLLGVYFLCRAASEYGKNVKQWIGGILIFGGAVVLGVMLSFPYTISLLNNVGGNGYAASRANQARTTLAWKYIRTMIFPYFRAKLPQHMNETTLYCGIMPVILFPLAFVRTGQEKKHWRLKLFYGIASLVITVLIFTHLLDGIFVLLPMINTSIKFRIITLLMFTMTVAAGLSLDDVIKNPAFYKQKIYLLGMLFVWGVALISAASKKMLNMTQKELDKLLLYDEDGYRKVLILFFGVMIVLGLYVLRSRKVWFVALMGLTIWDMTGFARQYFPLIDKASPVFPQPTDSQEYLIENTKEHERIVGMGSWDYIANSNIYYGLFDVRTHDFISTNPDMMAYYKAIEPTAYMSPTRIAFTKLQNYNLLKYLGTKYLVGENAAYVVTFNSKKDQYGDTNALPPGAVMRQQIDVTREDLYACQLLVGTNSTVFTQKAPIMVYIMDRYADVPVAKTTLMPYEISDNSFVRVVFGHVKIDPNRKYDLMIALPDDFEERLTFFTTAASEDSYRLTINGQKMSGHLIMKLEYLGECLEEIYDSKEGMKVAVFDEYAPKVSMAETVVVKEDEKKVLRFMKAGYHDHTVILAEEDDQGKISSKPLAEAEEAVLEEYRDDYIKIRYTAETDRYIMVNDYYHKNWKAYVGGKEVRLVRANYLLRAVEVPAGEEMTLELKYESSLSKVTCVIAGAGAVLLLLLAVFAKKLQAVIGCFQEKKMV